MSQKEDKMRIYNSREWRLLRDQKRTATPYCEKCRADGIAAGVLPFGYVTPVQVIHHIVPIETARDYESMRALALRYDNLQSLCFQCHSDIHKAMASRTKEGHKRAVDAALERWKQRAQTKPSPTVLS